MDTKLLESTVLEQAQTLLGGGSAKLLSPAELMKQLQALMKKVKEPVATIAEEGAYKGNPMFQVYSVNADGVKITNAKGQAWAKFQCGLGKARLILKHLEDLKAFVDLHKNDTATTEESAE